MPSWAVDGGLTSRPEVTPDGELNRAVWPRRVSEKNIRYDDPRAFASEAISRPDVTPEGDTRVGPLPFQASGENIWYDDPLRESTKAQTSHRCDTRGWTEFPPPPRWGGGVNRPKAQGQSKLPSDLDGGPELSRREWRNTMSTLGKSTKPKASLRGVPKGDLSSPLSPGEW